MIETPGQYADRIDPAAPGYPAENLRRFSFHTGARVRAIGDDEPCPVLFRDVGLDGMALFLRGAMRRLAGPLSPLVYARTAAYREPYADHGRIGRLAFLRPMELHPWHSGVPTIYVARATRTVPDDSIAFVPDGVPLAAAAALAASLRHRLAFREALGGRAYDERVEETLCRVERLGRELAESERMAAPLRAALQSPDPRDRERARSEMQRLGIGEHDLCAAYHHLPEQRRDMLREALPRVCLSEMAAAAAWRPGDPRARGRGV